LYKIETAYFDRSAPHNAHPVTPETSITHGISDTLHLPVESRETAFAATRLFFVGQAMRELMGFVIKEQPLTCLAAGLSPPSNMTYVKHVKRLILVSSLPHREVLRLVVDE